MVKWASVTFSCSLITPTELNIIYFLCFNIYSFWQFCMMSFMDQFVSSFVTAIVGARYEFHHSFVFFCSAPRTFIFFLVLFHFSSEIFSIFFSCFFHWCFFIFFCTFPIINLQHIGWCILPFHPDLRRSPVLPELTTHLISSFLSSSSLFPKLFWSLCSMSSLSHVQ